MSEVYHIDMRTYKKFVHKYSDDSPSATAFRRERQYVFCPKTGRIFGFNGDIKAVYVRVKGRRFWLNDTWYPIYKGGKFVGYRTGNRRCMPEENGVESCDHDIEIVVDDE